MARNFQCWKFLVTNRVWYPQVVVSVRCPATLLNDCNETRQDLERALAVLTTRADEALKAKADAEGSLATLHHRHADMEVPLRLAPSSAVPKRGFEHRLL